MNSFSQSDKERIAKAISEAEAKTSGEIVAVVAARSDDYFYIPVLWAAIVSLFVPWPLLAFTGLAPWRVFLVQLLVFLVVALATRIPALCRLLVPRAVMRGRAHHRAIEQYLAQGMHTGKGRTGVLIFVSIDERYAEIIADADIYARAAKSTWQPILDELVRHIEAGDPAAGFSHAIAASGEVLAEHFPPGESDHDELPNQLIMLD